MDLLAFEQRRRRGEETRSLIDALPEILTGRDRTGSGKARHLSTELPYLPVKGKRHLDRILGNDLMIRMSEMTEEELSEAATELTELEAEMSGLAPGGSRRPRSTPNRGHRPVQERPG